MNEKLIEEIEFQGYYMWRYYFEVINDYQYGCTFFVKELPQQMLLTILTWKNLIQNKNSLKYKAGCFWRFSYVYTKN